MGIKLDLSINEVNIVLASLGKQSYEVLAPVIAKIQEQGAPQAEAVAAEEKAAADAAPAAANE